MKQRYLEEPILQDDPWPPSIGQHYINLALIKHEKRAHTQQSFQEDLLRGKIDQIQQEKETITSDSMFTDDKGKTPFRMLMDGAPGVGKTTLCRKICQDWANGEILQDFMLVYVPLRDSRLAKAQRIEDLFYHDDPDVQDSMRRHVRKTQGARTVFIFDGFDELSKKERERESIFLDIFKGKILRQCSAVVSSRPYASDRLQRMSALTHHIEVLGFNIQQITTCIEKAISDPHKASGLIEQLKSREELLSLCYIPLNCAILIYVYTEEGYTVPRTISELFNLFISNTLQRQSDILNHDVHKETLKQHINTLSELAFNTLAEDKLAFGREEVPPLDTTLGLMTATKSFSSGGMVVNYQFIHLTIHEYLAAKWIASQFTQQQQAAFLQKHLLDDRFRMVLIFLAGITKFEDHMLREMLSTQKLHMYHDTTDSKKFNTLIHLAYESQNPKFCSTVANSVEGRALKHQLKNKFEVVTTGYFIAQSGCTWEIIDLDFERSSLTFFQQMQTALVSTSIKKFVLKYPLVSSTHQGAISLQTPFESMEYLDIENSMTELFHEPPLSDQFLPKPCLKHLYIRSYIRQTVLKNIISIVRNCKTLEYLELATEHRNSDINGYDLADLLKEVQQSSLKHFRVNINFLLGLNAFPGFSELLSSVGITKLVPDHTHEEVSAFHNAVGQLLLNKMDLYSLSLHTAETENCFPPAPDTMQNNFIPKRSVILDALRNSKLKQLSISSFLMSSKTPRQLATMLSANKQLHSLILRIDNIDHTILLGDLILGLKCNMTLRKLVVNYRVTLFEDADFILPLCHTLKMQSRLEILVIWPSDYHTTQVQEYSYRGGDYIPTLLLHNSTLSVVKINASFTERQMKRIARCLVLNGRRESIELEFTPVLQLGLDMQARNDNIIQSEVNEFKATLFTAMIELLAHLLATRQQRQENFLQVHRRVKTTEFTYSWETFEKRYILTNTFQQLPCRSTYTL